MKYYQLHSNGLRYGRLLRPLLGERVQRHLRVLIAYQVYILIPPYEIQFG